ncbi:MAG TPA: glycosyltransferase family 4 protein [candidate division Zixibacteria bacterium]|jgi:glycosyltransferase involved in cell wall biosynthesis
MDGKPRLAFIAPRVMGSFVRQDAEMLRAAFHVTVWQPHGVASYLRLPRIIQSCDLVLNWFAGRHAVIPSMLATSRGLPVATVIGGYEVEWIASLSYGIRPGSRSESFVHQILRRSHAILTVSQVTHQHALDRYSDCAGRMTMIPNGVDTRRFDYFAGLPRTSVLTVGQITGQTIELKGLNVFWDAARRTPHREFVAVGPAVDRAARRFVSLCPPNLRWRGYLDGDALVDEYRRASVYVQPSRHESFSLSTVEAMSCGCIPIVSDCGALPQVVGDAGVVLTQRTPEAVSDAIEQTFTAGEDARRAARAWAVNTFDTSRRKSALIGALVRLLTESPSPDKPGID